jgi:hypothetical protein
MKSRVAKLAVSFAVAVALTAGMTTLPQDLSSRMSSSAIVTMQATGGAEINAHCQDGNTALHFSPAEEAEVLFKLGVDADPLKTRVNAPVHKFRSAED